MLACGCVCVLVSSGKYKLHFKTLRADPTMLYTLPYLPMQDKQLDEDRHTKPAQQHDPLQQHGHQGNTDWQLMDNRCRICISIYLSAICADDAIICVRS